MNDIQIRSRAENAKSQSRRRSNSLPAHAVDYLKAWIMSPEHINHPYPTEKEKSKILADTGIDLKRLNNWFVNNRIRYWKPRIEALQKQQRVEDRSPSDLSSSMSGYGNECKLEDNDSPVIGFTDRGLFTIPKSSDAPVLIQPFADSMPVAPRSISAVSEVSTSTNGSICSAYDGEVSDDTSGGNRDVERKNEIAKAVLLLNEPSAPKSSRSKRKLQVTSPRTPRSKYSRKDIDLWRDVCKDSPRLDDENLPTFDEAALLFGFSIDHLSKSLKFD